MKKIILLLIIGGIAAACDGGSGGCSYSGHTLHVGDQGGCYYINSSSNKVYVDKSHCHNCY